MLKGYAFKKVKNLRVPAHHARELGSASKWVRKLRKNEKFLMQGCMNR
ncbi:hypothetical protein HAL013_07070 [Helicobacter ailurogastricus]|uniref:Uncharacterized protein n=1 Tax=Helicobacter ailurogastricus TaxID=1578720 RepID=A0A0K2X9X4_9HELI|nr:hypothetical protein HAL011_16180 [Helicobacter ailurogastricus]CRF42519.1 hypothetical protein HAL013_07070 [Helicobacter ailurogastricus]CRF44175.1 hypothetical protein HAL09_07480 [Helicobacter ailurogastricus]